MILFVACILVNVVLGVIFKLFPKYHIDNLQAITSNYIVSFILGSLILGRIAVPEAFYTKPWFPYALFLASVFIIGFNMIALTFQKFGITFTTIVQKMSLVIPVAIAILLFNESSSTLKFIGILCALASIVMINLNGSKFDTDILTLAKKYWYLPLVTFILSGIIETTLLYMEKNSISQGNDLEFVTMLFGMAGLLGILTTAFKSLKKGSPALKIKNVYAGIILGLPNFFTIYFLVLLLKNWDGSVVFPINNVGILALSALVAVVFFREALSRNRQIGLALAILSIYFISQF